VALPGAVAAEVLEDAVVTATTVNQAARTVAGVLADTAAVGEGMEGDHLMVVMVEAETAMETVDPAGGEKTKIRYARVNATIVVRSSFKPGPSSIL